MRCLVVKSLSKNIRVKLILLGVKLGLIYGTWTLLPIPWGYLYPCLFSLNSLSVKDSVSILQIHQPVSLCWDSLCWDRTDRLMYLEKV